MDEGGDENTKLYGINFDGSNPINLTPFKNVKCSIIDDLKVIAENPGNVSKWITDHAGKLRIAITTDGVNTGFIYRENDNANWQLIITHNFKENAIPLFFTFNNEAVYVLSNVSRDKKAIFEFDLKNKKEIKLIFEYPEVDVNQLIYSRKRRKITGVSFTTDRQKFHYFDNFQRKIQQFIDKSLPGHQNTIVSFDKEETKYIVNSSSDKTPGSYHFLDIKNWKISKLFDASPWFNEEEMAEMLPIEYTAHDGLLIHGYLTLPVGIESKNLPLIINPHGGPWCRDIWGFNPYVQFLANRGFAVLQMNFRGSTGYGRKFWKLGFKQWGLAMQDDITDAVNWAVKEKIADPKRVGIYGISYGGYATLMGIIKTPDLYSAAIDFVGITNLFTILEQIPLYWESIRMMLYEMIGHPERDKELFEQNSPALNADKIKTPLFIAQGANDPRVNKTESEQMIEALKIRGVEVEYMLKSNEGHGFYNQENIIDFYLKMESFLLKHILNDHVE